MLSSRIAIASFSGENFFDPFIDAGFIIQEVGVDVEIKRVLWVKARPDYEPLFSILDGSRQDADRRFWMERFVTPEDNCDIWENRGQISGGVESALQMSDKTSTWLANSLPPRQPVTGSKTAQSNLNPLASRIP
jgi:hypothetical protein